MSVIAATDRLTVEGIAGLVVLAHHRAGRVLVVQPGLTELFLHGALVAIGRTDVRVHVDADCPAGFVLAVPADEIPP